MRQLVHGEELRDRDVSIRRALDIANTALVNGLIMAPAPLLAVLMLARLHIAPWQYVLAFAAPRLGGTCGCAAGSPPHRSVRTARHAAPGGSAPSVLVDRTRVHPGGWAGVAIVAAIQLGLVTCCGVFNPVRATYRLEHTPTDRLARTLAAWTITTTLTVATLTAILGVFASVVAVRVSIAAAGVIMLATPLLLSRTSDLDSAEHRPAALAAA